MRKSISKPFLTVEDLEEPDQIQLTTKGTPTLKSSKLNESVSQRTSTLTVESKYTSPGRRSSIRSQSSSSILRKKKPEVKSVEKVFNNELIRGADLIKAPRKSILTESESESIRRNLGIRNSSTSTLQDRSASMSKIPHNNTPVGGKI